MPDILIVAYPWIKALHIIAVISWMAGLFYLPRLFVYHAEQSEPSDARDVVFQEMEKKLLKVIMTPAMIAAWIFGGLLAVTPGILDWSQPWVWVKLVSILMMTWFHHWLALKRKEFANGVNSRSGKTFRLMNEVPTVLMILIVISVVVKY